MGSSKTAGGKGGPGRALPAQGVTLKEVAALAGVSPITVSRALNRPEMVSPALRAKVEAAARELRYVQNRMAGALASSGSPVIPVVVPSLSNAVFIELIEGVQEVAQAAGFQLMLGNTDYDLEREFDWISMFLGWAPPGLIIAGTKHLQRTRALLAHYGRPVVETMEYGARPIDMNVGLSHHKAGAAMAAHLVERGYREIRFAGCRIKPDYRAKQRFDGFDGVLAAHGLRRAPPVTRELPSSPAAGGDMLMDILREDPGADAVFFANDDLAVGAILRAQREGIAVPGRIAVAGFNGLPTAELVTPSLTTIASPRRRIGQLAAEQLVKRISGQQTRPKRIDVSFELVVRNST